MSSHPAFGLAAVPSARRQKAVQRGLGGPGLCRRTRCATYPQAPEYWLREQGGVMGAFKSLSKRWAVTGAVCLMGLVAVPTGTASAAPAGAAPWTVQQTPANDGVGLTSVSCASGSSCVAVGATAPTNDDKPVVYGWNGSRWASIPAPADAAGSDLAAVACPSPSHCLAVGGNPNDEAQAWSWNGTKWSADPTYNPGSSVAILSAIECAGVASCEAVGVRISATDTFYPLAEHWNGKTWANQPVTGVSNGWLNSVSCGPAGKCEAVGYTDLAGNVEATLAVGLSGKTWVAQAAPALPKKGDGYELTGVSCFSNGCTAVGYSESGLLLAEALNGTKWALQSAVGAGAPAGSADAEWNGVQCLSASSCTAVGAWDNGTRPFLTLVDTWNGTVWAASKTPSPSVHGNELFGLSCASTGSPCRAVGGSQTSSSGQRSNSLAIGN